MPLHFHVCFIHFAVFLTDSTDPAKIFSAVFAYFAGAGRDCEGTSRLCGNFKEKKLILLKGKI
jgi:hypothetical protein